MPDSVYVVAAAPSRSRQVFDEIRAAHAGTWVLVATPEELTLERLRSLDPGRVFFLHWSWKVPAEIVRGFECVGFHMTDLPYGRGGSPLQNLILRGHRTTMLSAFRLVEALDAGPVYLKAELSLDGRAEEIYLRAARLAAHLIARILDEGPEPAPQEGEVVVFRRRTPEESRLPSDATPEQLYDFIRMLDAEGYPRAFVEIGGYRCELSHATLEDGVVRAQAAFTARPDGTRSL